jgi:hypothetical protein
VNARVCDRKRQKATENDKGSSLTFRGVGRCRVASQYAEIEAGMLVDRRVALLADAVASSLCCVRCKERISRIFTIFYFFVAVDLVACVHGLSRPFTSPLMYNVSILMALEFGAD